MKERSNEGIIVFSLSIFICFMSIILNLSLSFLEILSSFFFNFTRLSLPRPSSDFSSEKKGQTVLCSLFYRQTRTTFFSKEFLRSIFISSLSFLLLSVTCSYFVLWCTVYTLYFFGIYHRTNNEILRLFYFSHSPS